MIECEGWKGSAMQKFVKKFVFHDLIFNCPGESENLEP